MKLITFHEMTNYPEHPSIRYIDHSQKYMFTVRTTCFGIESAHDKNLNNSPTLVRNFGDSGKSRVNQRFNTRGKPKEEI